MSVLTFVSARSFASSRASYHCFLEIMLVQFWDMNSLFIPGAMFAAIIAASMQNVPLPQNGSTSILSACHGVSFINAAARVSEIGASFEIFLYPLLWRDSPEVSMVTSTISLFMNMRIGYSFPSSLNHSIPYFSFSFSTTAFLTILWMSEELNSFDLTETAFFTQNFPFPGM